MGISISIILLSHTSEQSLLTPNPQMRTLAAILILGVGDASILGWLDDCIQHLKRVASRDLSTTQANTAVR